MTIKQRNYKSLRKIIFIGAKVENMSHYIKPTLNHALDEMIIYIGINN